MILVLVTLLAGALGAVLRFVLARSVAPGRPWAVLIVNVAGSAIAGYTFGQVIEGPLSVVAVAIITGFCAGLTTFSTFTVETVQLVMAGKARLAAVSVLGNLVLGLGAAVIGFLAFILTR